MIARLPRPQTLLRLDALLAELEGAGTSPPTGDPADVLARHLAGFPAEALPAAAQVHWQEAARLLKARGGEPVPGRLAAAVRSWPQARLDALAGHLRCLQGVLERIENERWEDEIRDKVRHSYL